MPVDTITRSQIAQPNLPKLGELFFAYVSIGKSEKEFFEMSVGEVFASKEGTFLGETKTVAGNKTVSRSGPIKYEFTPSHLRTIYRLNFLTVELPPVFFSQLFTKEGSGEIVEIEYSIGWVVQLLIGGVPVFVQEPVAPESTGVLVSKEGALGSGSFTTLPKFAQVEFTADITATPGTSVEVHLIPFVRVVRVVKQGKLAGNLFNPNSVLKPAINQLPPCTLVYEQDFQQTRKRSGPEWQ